MKILTLVNDEGDELQTFITADGSSICIKISNEDEIIPTRCYLINNNSDIEDLIIELKSLRDILQKLK